MEMTRAAFTSKNFGTQPSWACGKILHQTKNQFIQVNAEKWYSIWTLRTGCLFNEILAKTYGKKHEATQ